MTAESVKKTSAGRRKAVCVGINNYGSLKNNLQGCVNDAQGWAQLLTENYDFPKSDVKLLLDSEATKDNIISNLKALLGGAKAGDVLVFTNSSHGSYLVDSDGDEEKYDEILCPYDIKTNHIVDDELRNLFANLPHGVNLTVILDNCHSGSGTRFAAPDRRPRFLDPSEYGARTLKDPFTAKPKSETKFPESGMNEILLSGCTDSESSFDAYFAGKYHGALSFYALQAIRAANYKLNYDDLHKRIVNLIEAYPQNPQLEGKTENKQRQIFS